MYTVSSVAADASVKLDHNDLLHLGSQVRLDLVAHLALVVAVRRKNFYDQARYGDQRPGRRGQASENIVGVEPVVVGV
jgi:hypothetical protein